MLIGSCTFEGNKEDSSRYGLLRSEAIQFRDKYQCFGVVVSIFRAYGKM